MVLQAHKNSGLAEQLQQQPKENHISHTPQKGAAWIYPLKKRLWGRATEWRQKPAPEKGQALISLPAEVPPADLIGGFHH